MSDARAYPSSIASRSPRQSSAAKGGKREAPSHHNLKARSQGLAGAMLAFRDSDFSCRLPSDWTRVDGQIAQAFNHAIAQEDRILREVERLSVSVGRDGRLKQRMLPGSIGLWATKVDSINTLIESAIAIVRDQRMDILMPDLDGYETM